MIRASSPRPHVQTTALSTGLETLLRAVVPAPSPAARLQSCPNEVSPRCSCQQGATLGLLGI